LYQLEASEMMCVDADCVAAESSDSDSDKPNGRADSCDSAAV